MAVVGAVLAAGLGVGCAATSSPSPGQQASATMHGECLVCKKNADLACIDVAIDSKTPTAQYQGKTYFFCSDECHDEFVKHPAKYISTR